ncbi:cuticle protein 19-like [Macrobrachium rosenbergii]|uniref:cuticle protein 19-like n=1 Tax=Macrobrachium rosenbergii TaxID=79674 RepID=UPI0034D74365
MASKVAIVSLVLVGMAFGLPTDPYGAPPSYKAAPMPYNFVYGVKDQYAGADYGHSEDSDGNTVKGSYTVQLPDGRRQTVNYIADHYNGFQAQVNYDGEAQYPHEYGPPITFKPKGYHR